MEKGAKGLKYLNIVNGSIQTKTYSFGAFTLVVIIILVAFAIRPTLVKITEINSQINKKRIVREELDAKLNSIASLTNEYAQNQSIIKSLPMIFPSQGNFSLLLSNIDEVSKRNGFSLKGINFAMSDEIPVKLSVLKPWSARISVTGPKANIFKLLTDFESMPMYPIVRKLSYAEESAGNSGSLYSIELVIFKVNDFKFYD